MEKVLDVIEVEGIQFVRTPYEGELWVTLTVAASPGQYRLTLSTTKAARLAELITDSLCHNVREQ